MPKIDNNTTPAKSSHNPVMSISRLVVYIVYLIAVFIEVVLLLRVGLLLFSANPNVPFVQFIYSTSSYFLAPFRGIFPAHASELTGGYLDVSALFAAVVYLIVVAAIQGMLAYLDRRN